MSHRVANAIENALTCVRGWTSASEATSVFCSDLDELFSLIVGMRNAKAAFVKFRRAQARQADGG